MEVILLERIEKLGQMGDVVKVKAGFARNYLLPQKKALRADKANLGHFETQRAQLEAENLERRGEAEAVAKQVDGLSVVLIRQAGDSGQLYGSVTSRDLTDSITAAGVTIEKRQVVLDKVIKVLGMHQVKIRLHPEVTVEITANVARSEAEAETQSKTGHMVSAEEQRLVEEAAVEATLSEVEEAEAAEAATEDDESAQAADEAATGDEEETNA